MFPKNRLKRRQKPLSRRRNLHTYLQLFIGPLMGLLNVSLNLGLIHESGTSVSFQVFPGDEFTTQVQFDMGNDDLVPVHQETKKFLAKVRIPCEVEDGRKFEYTAETSYTQQRFPLDKSETHEA
jgi:hypothetical protein